MALDPVAVELDPADAVRLDWRAAVPGAERVHEDRPLRVGRPDKTRDSLYSPLNPQSMQKNAENRLNGDSMGSWGGLWFGFHCRSTEYSPLESGPASGSSRPSIVCPSPGMKPVPPAIGGSCAVCCDGSRSHRDGSAG